MVPKIGAEVGGVAQSLGRKDIEGAKKICISYYTVGYYSSFNLFYIIDDI